MKEGVMTDSGIEEAASAIRRAEALVITAGAGMGVDSGLPDFRGDEGFWRAYPPLKEKGLSFAEMASASWFRTDPVLAWGFYGHRLHLYRNTVPHRGFQILRDIAEHMTKGVFVYTSNVDGQFQRAGFSENAIVECHGSIHHLQCATPCESTIWSAEDTQVNVDETTFLASRPLPRCPSCGNVARPNILMFGDWVWVGDRSEKQSERFRRWEDNIGNSRLVVIELGAGTAIPSVRSMSERLVRRSNGTLVRINVREAQVPPGQIGIAGTALATLERLTLHT